MPENADRLNEIARPLYIALQERDFVLNDGETVAEWPVIMGSFIYRGSAPSRSGFKVDYTLEVIHDSLSDENKAELVIDPRLYGRRSPKDAGIPLHLPYPVSCTSSSSTEFVEDITERDIMPALDFFLALNAGTPVFVAGDHNNYVGIMVWKDGKWMPHRYEGGSKMHENWEYLDEARRSIWEHFDPDEKYINGDILDVKPTDLGRWRRI